MYTGKLILFSTNVFIATRILQIIISILYY